MTLDRALLKLVMWLEDAGLYLQRVAERFDAIRCRRNAKHEPANWSELNAEHEAEYAAWKVRHRARCEPMSQAVTMIRTRRERLKRQN